MLVTFRTKPAYGKEFEEALRIDLEHARTEEGNLSMYLYETKESPGTYFLFERWKNQQALDEHFEKPYTKAVLGLSEKALADPMEILYLRDLAPLSPVHYDRAPVKPEEAVELVVIFSVKEGLQQKFIRQFEYSVANSRLEAGCIAFHIHSVDDQPDIFVLYERWESQAVLDSHFEQPYTKKLFRVFEEVLEKPLEDSIIFMSLIK